MTVSEMHEYMRALVCALAHVHGCGIIHRDIKHGNFLYNRRLKQLCRPDFHFYFVYTCERHIF